MSPSGPPAAMPLSGNGGRGPFPTKDPKRKEDAP